MRFSIVMSSQRTSHCCTSGASVAPRLAGAALTGLACKPAAVRRDFEVLFSASKWLWMKLMTGSCANWLLQRDGTEGAQLI